MSDGEKVQILVRYLEQILKGEGRFSNDQMTHAENTIQDMKQLAIDALAEIGK